MVLTQFVIDAIALGGIGGVALGVGLILALGIAAPLVDSAGGAFGHFSPVLSLPPILTAFGISLAIGILAGSYPAWRASWLAPIDALRYE